jgi:hypothetical protein
MTQSEIIEMAQNIASETFVKNGNKAVSFTDNVELRCLVGGRYASYKELSKLVIGAYNEMQCELIMSNI